MAQEAAGGVRARDLVRDLVMDNCTVARSLEILGEKWTFIVLRDVFLGIRRFDDFIARNGIPRQVLSKRLATLTSRGILRKETYQEPGARPRAEYRLTDKGMAVYPILVAMRQWGDRYEADPEGPPLLMLHRDCGAEVSLRLHCADGHELDSPRQVTLRPGPSMHRPRPDGPDSADSA